MVVDHTGKRGREGKIRRANDLGERSIKRKRNCLPHHAFRPEQGCHAVICQGCQPPGIAVPDRDVGLPRETHPIRTLVGDVDASPKQLSIMEQRMALHSDHVKVTAVEILQPGRPFLNRTRQILYANDGIGNPGRCL